MPDHQGLA